MVSANVISIGVSWGKRTHIEAFLSLAASFDDGGWIKVEIRREIKLG